MDLKASSKEEFDSIAHIYDSQLSLWYFNYFYKRVGSILGNISGKRLLSVGCGTATLEVRLAKIFPEAQIVCLDLSEKMLGVAKKKAAGLNNIKFILGDAEMLPLSGESFDLLICLHSFHHYPDQEKALREFRRVLKEGGELYLLDAMRSNPVSKMWVWFIEHVLEPGVHHFTPEELKFEAKKAGFRSAKVTKMFLGLAGILRSK